MTASAASTLFASSLLHRHPECTPPRPAWPARHMEQVALVANELPLRHKMLQDSRKRRTDIKPDLLN